MPTFIGPREIWRHWSGQLADAWQKVLFRLIKRMIYSSSDTGYSSSKDAWLVRYSGCRHSRKSVCANLRITTGPNQLLLTNTSSIVSCPLKKEKKQVTIKPTLRTKSTKSTETNTIASASAIRHSSFLCIWSCYMELAATNSSVHRLTPVF